MTTSTIREAATVSAGAPDRAGNMLIQLITPGVGSSGVYSEAVLEEAAKSRAFPAGTLMFADHPGESESYDRPERSIRDVAGVLVEDARWDGSALVAEARTYTPWTTVLSEMKDAIGVSIRATATVEEADSAGRPIIASIEKGVSVDFVTHAGRGGAIREVYESARGNALIVTETSPVAEASANIRDTELRGLVRAAHGSGSGTYAYVVDYDEAARTVTFEVEGDGATTRVYTQTYTITNDVATALEGQPVEVRRVISYVPVGESDVPVIPAGQSTTHESEEDTMPQIEESRLAALEEADRRVPTLVTERDAAVAERDTARAEVTEARRRTATAEARAIVAEADYDFNQLERRGLLAELPLTESGELDTEAFTATVTEAAATAAEAAGAGRVRGLGGTATDQDGEDLSEADLDAELARMSGRTVKEA